MDLMAMFRKTGSQQAANNQVIRGAENMGRQQQGGSGQPNQNGDPNSPANMQGGRQDPNNPGGNNNNQSQNPLAQFEKLFDNTGSGTSPNQPPRFQLDQATLERAAGSIDFSNLITPELQERFKNGDSTVLAELLNSVGRQLYQTSLQHTSALTDRYVDMRLGHDRQSLGQSVRKELTAEKLSSIAKDNPALQAQVKAIGEKVLNLFPDASPEFIAERTVDYFVDVAKLLKPDAFKSTQQQGQGNESSQPQETIDWARWMSGGSNKS